MLGAFVHLQFHILNCFSILQGIINKEKEGPEKWEFNPESLQNINNKSGVAFVSPDHVPSTELSILYISLHLTLKIIL